MDPGFGFRVYRRNGFKKVYGPDVQNKVKKLYGSVDFCGFDGGGGGGGAYPKP